MGDERVQDEACVCSQSDDCVWDSDGADVFVDERFAVEVQGSGVFSV
jgi:hypothetical protein